MNSKVEEVIINLEGEVKRLLDNKHNTEQAERRRLLFNLGLYEKKYSKDNHSSNEYPYQEFAGKETKYYKLEVLDITDEEYNKILLLQAQKDQLENNIKANNDNVFIYVIAFFIYLISFAIGLKAILNNDSNGIVILFSGFIAGSLLTGIEKIMKLLDQIKNKY